MCVSAKEFSARVSWLSFIALQWFGLVSLGLVRFGSVRFCLFSFLSLRLLHFILTFIVPFYVFHFHSIPFPRTPIEIGVFYLFLQSYVCCWRWFKRMCEKSFELCGKECGTQQKQPSSIERRHRRQALKWLRSRRSAEYTTYRSIDILGGNHQENDTEKNTRATKTTTRTTPTHHKKRSKSKCSHNKKEVRRGK